MRIKFPVDALFRKQVMDYQVDTIVSAMRSVFADLVILFSSVYMYCRVPNDSTAISTVCY